jgi:hypothetical protein
MDQVSISTQQHLLLWVQYSGAECSHLQPTICRWQMMIQTTICTTLGLVDGQTTIDEYV